MIVRAVCALPVGNVPDCRTCCPTGTRACCRTSKRGSRHVRLYPLGIFPTESYACRPHRSIQQYRWVSHFLPRIKPTKVYQETTHFMSTGIQDGLACCVAYHSKSISRQFYIVRFIKRGTAFFLNKNIESFPDLRVNTFEAKMWPKILCVLGRKKVKFAL